MKILGREIIQISFDEGRKEFRLYSSDEELIFVIPDSIMSTLISDSMLMEIEMKLNEEELKNKALDRIAQLRNLNHITHITDISAEFEAVPAYIRRNVQLGHFDNSIMYGEHYSVKALTSEGRVIALLPNDYSEQVFIYLPAKKVDIFDGERLTNACGDFMEALDFELTVENEPILGSYIQKLWFKVKKGAKVSRDEVVQDFAKGKKALELKYVELPTAEQTEKLANSAAKIIESLEGQDEGIVRLGALLILKKQVDSKPKIFIQQLNLELITLFDKTPQLLFNLQTTYEILTGDVKGAKHLDESGTEQLSI